MDFAANIMGFHGAFLHVAAKISQTKIQLDISSPACISCDHRFARKFANEMRKKRVRVSCDLFAASSTQDPRRAWMKRAEMCDGKQCHSPKRTNDIYCLEKSVPKCCSLIILISPFTRNSRSFFVNIKSLRFSDSTR